MGHEDDASAHVAFEGDDPVLLARLLEASPYLTFLLDAGGQVVWINAAVERIFGYRPDEVVGTNILDHIDAEWDPGALGSIAESLAGEGLRLPTVFQAFHADGSTMIIEVWANSQLDDPTLQGLVVCARRWDERVLLDRAFESLAAGGALEQTLALLVEVMASETLEAQGAVLYDRVGGGLHRNVSHPDLPPELGGAGLGRGGAASAAYEQTPWEVARRTGDPVAVGVDDLPEPLRRAAAETGHDMCWVWPVAGDGGVEACLVVWRRGIDVTPDFTRVRLLESLVRLARLAFERERTVRHLEHAASHDPLTRLANRARFYDVLDQTLADPGSDEQVCVLYLDLDGFKPVNDRYGHGAGDDVLAAVANRLARTVREGDLVARVGGDEFAVLCPQVQAPGEPGRLAERLLEVVSQPYEVRGRELRVGVSIGVSLASAGYVTSDRLVDAADRALYRVKGSGKGGWWLEQLDDAQARG